jgi:hypothetical protein
MKILSYIPHFGWFFGLASSMPQDSFYIINKVESDEQRGSDLCVQNGYWSWIPSLKPKPINVTLLGQSFSEVDFDDYDVIILIPDAGQLKFIQKYGVGTKIPVVWKFHLNDPTSKAVFSDLRSQGKELPTLGYPCIFSAQSQKEFYGFDEGEVAWSQNPEVYQGWKGDIRRAMWTCERIGNPVPGDGRYANRGGMIWDQIRTKVNSIRYGLDFRLGTPITSFEELITAYRLNRCYVECAVNTILTDGLVEAMMTGMPPVVYDSWEMSRVIDQGVNGFKSRNVDEMILFIKNLLDDPDLARKIGKEARNTALKVWSPKVSEEAYHKSIEKAFEVYNRRTGHFRNKVPHTVEISTADTYMLNTSMKRIQELDLEFYTKHTGVLECPHCFERLKIVHLKREHSLEPFEKRTDEDRRVPIEDYKWESLSKQEETIAKSFEPQKVKKDEPYYTSNFPCKYCHSNQVEKDGEYAVCVACKRKISSWIEWAARESRET